MPAKKTALAKKTSEVKKISQTKKIVKDLLENLSIKAEKITVEETKDIIDINIKSDDSALLIGRNGENIFSLQLLLNIMTYKKAGEWQKISLNVNDWRQQREEYLTKMASNLAQRAKFSGKQVYMPYLNSQDRRIIHMYLADFSDISTSSEGEGNNRRLVIQPKAENAENANNA